MQPNPGTSMDSSPVTSSVSSATQEFLKTAVDPGNDRKKYTLNSETSNSSSTNDRPLADIISDKFEPFDSAKFIITPFEAEHSRDVGVDEEYTTMLLDAVLETHAWASARFKCKSQLECQQLEDQHLRILEKEKEQGMCSPTVLSSSASFSSSVSKFRNGIVEKARESLADFVIKMKKALAALTGVET